MTPTEAVEVVEELLDPDQDDFTTTASTRAVEALRSLCAYVRGLGLVGCQHEGCDERGTFRMFWPGREPLIVCKHHKHAAQSVAKCLDVLVRWEGVA